MFAKHHWYISAQHVPENPAANGGCHAKKYAKKCVFFMPCEYPRLGSGHGKYAEANRIAQIKKKTIGFIEYMQYGFMLGRNKYHQRSSYCKQNILIIVKHSRGRMPKKQVAHGAPAEGCHYAKENYTE